MHDVDTLDLLYSLKHPPFASGELFDDDHSLVLTGGGSTIRVWDQPSKQIIHEFAAHPITTTPRALSKNGLWLVTRRTSDDTIRIWPAVWRFKAKREHGAVQSVSVAPNGKLFATLHVGPNGVHIRSTATPYLSNIRLPVHGQGFDLLEPLELLSWAPTSKRLAVCRRAA